MGLAPPYGPLKIFLNLVRGLMVKRVVKGSPLFILNVRVRIRPFRWRIINLDSNRFDGWINTEAVFLPVFLLYFLCMLDGLWNRFLGNSICSIGCQSLDICNFKGSVVGSNIPRQLILEWPLNFIYAYYYALRGVYDIARSLKLCCHLLTCVGGDTFISLIVTHNNYRDCLQLPLQ